MVNGNLTINIEINKLYEAKDIIAQCQKDLKNPDGSGKPCTQGNTLIFLLRAGHESLKEELTRRSEALKRQQEALEERIKKVEGPAKKPVREGRALK